MTSLFKEEDPIARVQDKRDNTKEDLADGLEQAIRKIPRKVVSLILMVGMLFVLAASLTLRFAPSQVEQGVGLILGESGKNFFLPSDLDSLRFQPSMPDGRALQIEASALAVEIQAMRADLEDKRRQVSTLDESIRRRQVLLDQMNEVQPDNRRFLRLGNTRFAILESDDGERVFTLSQVEEFLVENPDLRVLVLRASGQVSNP